MKKVFTYLIKIIVLIFFILTGSLAAYLAYWSFNEIFLRGEVFNISFGPEGKWILPSFLTYIFPFILIYVTYTAWKDVWSQIKEFSKIHPTQDDIDKARLIIKEHEKIKEYGQKINEKTRNRNK
jgi:hypothetical protein